MQRRLAAITYQLYAAHIFTDDVPVADLIGPQVGAHKHMYRTFLQGRRGWLLHRDLRRVWVACRPVRDRGWRLLSRGRCLFLRYSDGRGSTSRASRVSATNQEDYQNAPHPALKANMA